MKRRAFIALLAGAALWPLTPSAQQGERVRRIGVLLPLPPVILAGFFDELGRLGFVEGRNLTVDRRTAALRRPAVYQWPDLAEQGGLVGYGPRFAEIFRQWARQLAKVLAGTAPADLPVEQPTKFELVINLKAAQALGLEIPPTLLVRADHVIE